MKRLDREELEMELGSWAYREQQAYMAYQALPVEALEARRAAQEEWYRSMLKRAEAYAALTKYLRGIPPARWNEKWEPGDG